uniref:Uncharacterized protein n=1 Tax=Solanum tuberosum TaxID=4113 RepID=M1DHR5_SOLTU
MLKTHDDMWNYIKEEYDIPEVGKYWALGEIKLAWRGYKCRLKKMHIYAYADDATRMAKRPKFVSESVFKEIIEHWNSDEAKLQRLNPGLTLDPNMLRFTVGSPRDGAALQLINRLFVGCNNQGIENEERGEDHSNEDDIDLT